MQNKTFTYTARSSDNPDKMATFTLQNGSVSVQLGNAILEQVESIFDAYQDEESNRLKAWIEPAATGALQKVMQPISLTDFEADMHDDTLQTMAWIRAAGLRLAPIMVNWSQVDNPAGARAFVQEVQRRKESMQEAGRLPALFDYWASWILTGLLSIILPWLWWRLWRTRRALIESPS